MRAWHRTTRACHFDAGDSLTPKTRPRAELLQLHDVRAPGRGSVVEARHRFVIDDRRIDDAEAIELGAHRAAIGAEHADLDIVADAGVAGKLERSGHAVEIVAGRPIEAELHRPRARLLIA